MFQIGLLVKQQDQPKALHDLDRHGSTADGVQGHLHEIVGESTRNGAWSWHSGVLSVPGSSLGVHLLLQRVLPNRDVISETDHLGVEGPIAFWRPEVQESLHLDPKQVQTIQALITRAVHRMADEVHAVAASVPPARGPFTPERSRALYESKPYQDAIRREGEITRKARNDTLQAVMNLLTKDQRADYLAMLGKPFDLARLRSRKPTP